jgi:hypothetical protein
MQDELAALAAFIGRRQRDLDAKLIRLVRFTNASVSGSSG